MKLKYYLRGLGIGLMVTATICMLGGAGKAVITDDEVIARAEQLGMIQNPVLSQLPQPGSESNEVEKDKEKNEMNDLEKPSEEDTLQKPSEEDAPEDPSEEDVPEDPSEEDVPEAPSEEDVPEDTSEEDVLQEASEEESESDPETSEEITNEYITITIVSGDSSVSVSRKVFEAGLVKSASEFDSFLCANGYDRILSVGEHRVKAGASMKEIAEALAGR